MNMEYYQNFITIVNNGGFSQASQKLHIAQSALSRQVHLIEQEYGAVLLKSGKGSRKLILTDAGWVFYRQAVHLCEAEKELRYEIENYKIGIEGTLTFSITPARSPLFVKRYAKPFTKEYPKVSYEIHEQNHLDLIEDIRQGRSEIGIASAPISDPNIFEILFERKESLLVAGLASDTNFQTKLPMHPRDLLNHPLAYSRYFTQFVNQASEIAGSPFHSLAIVDTRATSLRYAEEGLAWAIIPWEAIEELPAGIAARPLAGMEKKITKTIFHLRGQILSPVMKRFLKVYERELTKIRFE